MNTNSFIDDAFIYASVVLKGLSDASYRGIEFKNTRNRTQGIRIIITK